MSPFPRFCLAASACLLLLVSATASFAQDPGAKTSRGPGRPTDSSTNNSSAVVERFGSFLVGDDAPDVDLTDTNGIRFHLADARGAGPWLLVFARDPVDLEEAQAARSDLAALGIGVIGIGPFRREVATADPTVVRLLPDRASHVARVYGMFDPVTSNPRAGAFLVGKNGHLLLIVSGGLPSRADLVRMSKEALAPPRRTTAEATN